MRLFILAIVLAGCGQLLELDDPRLATPLDRVSDVIGVENVEYLQVDGVLAVPVDLSDATIEALWFGDDGVHRYPGTGRADGRFVIPEVPDGVAITIARTLPGEAVSLWVTRTHDVDLSRRVLGSPKATALAAPTPISIHIPSMEPWTEASSLTAYAAGTWTSLDLFPEPALEATSIDAELDWSHALDADGTNHRITAAPGDGVRLARYVEHIATDQAPAYRALESLATGAPVLQSDGAVLELTVPLVPASSCGSLALASRLNTLDQRLNAALGEARSFPTQWRVVSEDRSAWGNDRGLPLATGTLDDDVSDGPIGELALAAPESRCGLVLGVEQQRLRTYTRGILLSITATSSDGWSGGAFVMDVPVGFASAFRVGDTELTEDELPIVIDPEAPVELGWSLDDRPVELTSIVVVEVSFVDEQPVFEARARLLTTEDRVWLPPGILTSGHRYVLRVTTEIGRPDAALGGFARTDWPRAAFKTFSPMFVVP